MLLIIFGTAFVVFVFVLMFGVVDIGALGDGGCCCVEVVMVLVVDMLLLLLLVTVELELLDSVVLSDDGVLVFFFDIFFVSKFPNIIYKKGINDDSKENKIKINN